MRVAYYSPMPPERSGIADYSALLVPALRRRLDVDVARRGKRARGDVALYHVGNDPESHAWIVEALRREPGVVALHDFVLHHLVAGMTLARKDVGGYLAAMEREAGIPGRLLGLGVVDRCIPPLWEVRPADFPLCGEVLDLATGVIVHSRHVELRVRERGYAGPVWRIPMPAWPEPDIEPARLDGEPLLGAFGHMNTAKRVPQLLEAFARFHESRPRARLLLVGSATAGVDLDARIAHEGLGGVVLREDYVAEDRLWALLKRADCVVSLRFPTMGETSAMVVRALSVGKPLIVTDIGWFSELPGDVALKVAPDEREVALLVAAMETVADRAVRDEMSARARELTAGEHDLERSAELYAAALEEAAGGEAVREAVLREVSEAAAAVGLEPALDETGAVGSAVGEVEI